MQIAERVLGIAADRGPGVPGDRYLFGSGFLVSGRAVLTCAHVVAGARTVLLDDALGNQYTGRVVRLGDPRRLGAGTAPDLAIVEIDEPGLDAPAVPPAEIDRSGMGSLESVRVVGWPRFMDAEDGGRRSTYAAVGKIEEMTRRREGLLRVDVTGSPPANAGSGSPWAGLSGAPVLADGHLIGVVTTHGLSEGPTALTAIPITDLVDDWWPLLGADHASPRYIVRPGPPSPACVVHHQTILGSLAGYRSSLLDRVVTYIEPRPEAAWHPRNVWQRLRAEDGSNAVLLSGHGGVGKTRTLLEVAGLALEDGWTVLHVSKGNAAGVVDHLATVVRTGFTPVLLVIDYLNLSVDKALDLTQLLALAQQSRIGTSPRLAVLASARTGWLLTPSHARDTDGMEPIRLEPEPDDMRAICADLAKAAAPNAAEKLGLDTLLEYTDTTRPILTLLVARQIEDRVTHGLPALPRADMETKDLRKWLELRLDEDHLVPRLDSTESLYGPAVEVHMQAAAAVLLATPGDEPALLESASQMFGEPEPAANLLRLLIKMGWLINSDGVLDAVHDVVTDFLVTGVMFWSTTQTLRPAMPAELLDAAGRRPASLEHALVALSRIADDIAEKDRAAELVHAIDAWFAENREPVVRLLLQDPVIGARTAAEMLSSGMLTTARQAYWDHAFSPLLTTLDYELEAYPLLLAAVRDLPAEGRDVAAELGDHAVSWLTGRSLTGVEQLLRLLLRRDDLPQAQARAAVGLAVDWLHLHSRDARADFLLSATLMCGIVNHEADPDLERLTGFALEWLATNGTQLGASYLLRALSRLKQLPAGVVASVVTRALSWLGTYGETIEASFVLPGFLTQKAVPRERFADFAGAARAWLALHRTRPEANFVLAHLLSNEDLDAEVVAETFDHMRTWLEHNSGDPTADYLIRRVLGHPALPAEMAPLVRTAASAWLSSYQNLETATYLVQVVIQTDGLPAELRAAAFSAADTWLRMYGRRLNANFLLQALVLAKELPEELRDNAFATAEIWLRTHGRHLSANHFLQVLIPADRLPAELRATTLAAAETWLRTHSRYKYADYLLRLLIPAGELPAELRTAVLAAAGSWLQTYGRLPDARSLIEALVQDAGELPDDLRAITFAAAGDWLEVHGEHFTANHLLQVLIPADGLPAELRAAALSTARSWLRTHGGHLNARHLMETLLRAGDLPEDVRPAVVAAAVAWLRTYGGHPEARYLLETLLREAGRLPEDSRTDAFAAVKTWLLTHGREVTGRQFLESMLRTGGLSLDLRNAALAAAYAWLETHAEQFTANYLLQVLLDADRLPEDLRTLTFASSATWMQTHGQESAAHHLMQPLLQADGVPEELRTAVLAAAFAWLPEHGQLLTAHYLVEALLQTKGLAGELRDTAFATAQDWLETHSQHLDAHSLIAVVLQNGETPAQLREITVRMAEAWLKTHGEHPNATFLLQVLVPAGELPEDLRATTFATTQAWLEKHGRQFNANYLLKVLLKADGLPEELRATTFATTRAWLEKHGEHFNAVHLLQVILKADGLTEELRATMFATIQAWLERHGRHANAIHLLEMTFRADGLPESLAVITLDTTKAWLETHGEQYSATYLLQLLVSADDLPEGLRAIAIATAQTWLQARSRQLDARHLLESLLEADAVPAGSRAVVLDAAASWLDLWWQDASAVGVLRALLRVASEGGDAPDLRNGANATLIGQALRWLSCFGSTMEARPVITPLLRSPAPDEQIRRQLLLIAVAWLNEHADSPKACEIIPNVLDSPQLPEDALIDAFNAAQTWLCRPRPNGFMSRYVIAALFRRQADHPDRVQEIAARFLVVLERGIDAAQSRFALSAVLTEPGLSAEVRQTVLRLARKWLTLFAQQPSAHVLLAATATRGDLTPDESEWFEQFVRDWLGGNAQTPNAATLAQALLDGAVTLSPALHDELVGISPLGEDQADHK